MGSSSSKTRPPPQPQIPLNHSNINNIQNSSNVSYPNHSEINNPAPTAAPTPVQIQNNQNQEEPKHPVDEFFGESISEKEKLSKPSNDNPEILKPSFNKPISNQNISSQNQNIPQQHIHPPNQNPNNQPQIGANPNQPQYPIPIQAVPPGQYVRPVGVVPLQYSAYPAPYYPGQPIYQPYPYMPRPPVSNTVVVLPPGYKQDFSLGYSPYGNIADDLNNII